MSPFDQRIHVLSRLGDQQMRFPAGNTELRSGLLNQWLVSLQLAQPLSSGY